MTEKTIEACIELLETTLGDMPSRSADSVVRGVIAVLKSQLNTQPTNPSNF
jgi:hypothetical protein